MSTFKLKNSRTALLTLTAISLPLSACAGGGAAYQPIIDGPLGANYASDISGCRQVAERRNYNNSDTRTGALLGAGFFGLGALGDDDDNDVGDVIGGALIGGLLGGAISALETRSERKDIVRNCMSGRGYSVLG